MDNEELNRYIHEEIMGLCPNRPKAPDWSKFDDEGVCKTCGKAVEPHETIPNYTTSLDAIRLVEEKVIELLRRTVKNPNVIYCRYLMAANGFAYDDLGYLYEQVIRATAEQRATACVNAWKEHKGK